MSGFVIDLRKLPGWWRVSEDDYGHLIAIAERYLREYAPNPEAWIDWTCSVQIPWVDIAGFRAFRLLQTQAPLRLSAFPSNVWAKWAPVFIAYPVISNDGEERWLPELVAETYRRAPAEVLATFLRRVDAMLNDPHPSIERLLSLMTECWDDRISALVLDKAAAPDTPAPTMGPLLSSLLNRGDQAAVRLALSAISEYSSGTEISRDRAAVSAALLLKHAPGIGWPELWTALQEDETFADNVLGRIVWDDRHSQVIAAGFSNEQLVCMYLWLFRRFPPPAGSPEGVKAGFVDYPMAVTEWRGTLLTQLKARGTKEACQAIEAIIDALPGENWLKTILTEAKTIARQLTWDPPSPEEILALSRSSELRLVENADQLLDAVVESLRRLEAKLQLAEPPRAIDLWNEIEKGKYRPKEEERLSDYLKGHLDDDLRDRGILFNREVTNRPGEETDIRVDAVVRPIGDSVSKQISIVIEVKGCWNEKMKSAMESQLVQRYLRNANTSHGLYVVGWYNCEKWDKTDSRRRKAPKYEKSEAERRLVEQASGLSRDGICVRAMVIDTSLAY